MKKLDTAVATRARVGRSRAWRGCCAVAGGACVLALCLGWAAVTPARAASRLAVERSVAQFMVIDNERRAIAEQNAAALQHTGVPRSGEPEAPEELDVSHNVAALPQLGYDPSVGFIFGGKFSYVNFGDTHMNLDVGATQSTGGETDFEASWGTPRLFGSDFIGLVRARYQLYPNQDFYGLGNNDVGDDALSQHEQHATSLLFTLARRLAPHWVAAGTIGYDRVTIGPGDPDHDKTSTTDTYSRLPGIKGGYNNPLSLSIIYNNRHDLTRPQQGWSVTGKVTHVGPELGNDFHYTRFTGDASYVHPIGSPRHLIGIRVDGQYVTGSGSHLPFYEYSSLGGFDNLEGFYPNRFLGQSRVFARLGYQTLLADFNFRDIWRVRLDGTLFGGAGRVFLDRSRLPDDLSGDMSRFAPGRDDAIQFSYGAGLQMALGEALTTRLDVGFSGESKGLVYLSFGNAF